MEAQLTQKLLSLGLKDEKDVTRNSLGDCLFLCFARFVQSCDTHSREVTKEDDGSVKIALSTHSTRQVEDRTVVDITTIAGLRQLAADSARAMLSTETPSPVADRLKQHMLHRFRSSYLRERDEEVLGEAAIADGGSEAEKLTAWYSLMETTGVLRRC
jgi:hypothetical protein